MVYRVPRSGYESTMSCFDMKQRTELREVVYLGIASGLGEWFFPACSIFKALIFILRVCVLDEVGILSTRLILLFVSFLAS